MSTSPAEQHKAGKGDLVQYVEELAGPEEYPEGDAWMSLTDAARITRTSEAMTRRWVTSGRLKVKKEPVGVPPRTRLVRLSDVAKIVLGQHQAVGRERETRARWRLKWASPACHPDVLRPCRT